MLDRIRQIVANELFPGFLMLSAGLLAILLANSPWAPRYDDLLEITGYVAIGQLVLSKPLLLWINDGLMTIFFLFVGMEIKAQFLDGELRNHRQILLPVAGALGGMIVPALIFLWINAGLHPNTHGWAIPVATDIAFSLVILSLLGKRAPPSLTLFLMTLAVLDDLGAILIIAIHYSHTLSATPMALVAATTVLLIIFNRSGVTRIDIYVVVGLFLWVFMLKSGLHATLSGVILAFTIPLRGPKGERRSPLKNFEFELHPWVAFVILPLFAFFNTGLPLHDVKPATLVEPLPLGITLGLFLGKPIGVFSATWLVVQLGWASMPRNSNWLHIHGVALLCGVGFTMSLFIGSLAFEGLASHYSTACRLGVLTGSLLSALAGIGVLWLAHQRQTAARIHHRAVRPIHPLGTGSMPA